MQYGIYLLIDEVQTGCGATGTMWHHEQWNLPYPPDAVSFSKKTQIAGFYCTDELRATEVNHAEQIATKK